MATIKIEIPDIVSAAKFEIELREMARRLGLVPIHSANRVIKLQATPEVDRKIRRNLVAFPSMRELSEGSRIGANVRAMRALSSTPDDAA